MFAAPFPDHSYYPDVANRGATTAPLNITRRGDAIIVPVLYDALGGRDLRLIAFSASGGVLAETLVASTRYEITSHSFLDDLADWLAGCFHLVSDGGCNFVEDGRPVPFLEAGFPMPGVAIQQSLRPGSTPSIWMSDSLHDKITYSFSPWDGFAEVFRSTHTARQFTTPPVVANGKTAVGTADGYLTFTDLGFTQWAAVGGLGYLTAAPTRLNDGRLVVIARSGLMTVLSGNNFVVWQSQLAGQSIASAAASCTHVFVSTTNEFITFNAKTLAQVASVPWEGGGLAAPVIGPSGHVYAIASDNLYVFPPPRFGDVLGKTACDQLTFG